MRCSWVAEACVDSRGRAAHGLPLDVVRVVGLANLVYATYGGRLAWRLARGVAPSRGAVLGLVLGNAAWLLVCVGLAAAYRAVMRPGGFVHALGEGMFVGTLAALGVAERAVQGLTARVQARTPDTLPWRWARARVPQPPKT